MSSYRQTEQIFERTLWSDEKDDANKPCAAAPNSPWCRGLQFHSNAMSIAKSSPLAWFLFGVGISSVAVLFTGCRIGGPQLAKKQNTGLDNGRPILILSSGHTEADLTNRPATVPIT